MVYGHTVKKNGILYKAGQTVPDNNSMSQIKSDPEVLKEEQKPKRGRPPKTEA